MLVLALQVAPHVQDDFDLPEEGLQEVDPRNREENQVGAHAQQERIESGLLQELEPDCVWIHLSLRRAALL